MKRKTKPVEGCDERERNAAFRVHFSSKEDVLGQVFGTEVVLTETKQQMLD